MTAEMIVDVARFIAKLGPEVYSAFAALVAAVKEGQNPTAAERHLQVVAAIKLLQIEE